jgi:hypothetical protein
MPKHSTIDQLRDDIDHGRTGDKVEFSDPAAAPLGTDEEAAGTPIPGHAVQQARDYERAMGRIAHGVDARRAAARRVSSVLWLYCAFGLAALVLAGVWLLRPG